MVIEIDQSGKIENTNKLTVLGFSNSKSHSVIILAKDKKYIQNIFRKIGQPKIFVYKLFSIGIYFLIKDNVKSLDRVVIDREYPGYENLIKQMIKEIFEYNKITFDSKIIHFSEIGKKSNAHHVSHKAFISRRANKVLKLSQILKYVR